MTVVAYPLFRAGRSEILPPANIFSPRDTITPFTSAPNEMINMINTYYYVNTSAEVEAILRDGFINEYKETTTGVSGVYLANSPGEPDPEYPKDQLLEIILPPEISISEFEVFKDEEGVRWREWLVPAGLLNECAEIRLLPKAQWAQKWDGRH